MERYDWPLLALYVAEAGKLSPVQVQKTLFLFAENMPEAIDAQHAYNFIPYHYGPFDAAIYRDLKYLIASGFVQSGSDAVGKDFSITSRGKDRINELLQAEPRIAPATTYMTTLTEWVKSLTFEALIKSIYRAYPHFKTNSIFKHS